MVAYRYLGSALTNANGVATFDYQGTGAGEIDVIASLDNPITDGSIVSGTFSVIDGLFKCEGTTGKVNSNWIKTNLQTSTDGNGTTVSNTTSNNLYYRANLNDTSQVQDFQAPYCIEFDIISFTGSSELLNWASGQIGNKALSELGITENNHIKVEVLENVIKYYRDGTKLNMDKSVSSSNPYTVGFTLPSNSSLKYKNFVIYPI